MKFLETELAGVLIIQPDVFRDDRGFFLETFREDQYRGGGIGFSFVQDNHSRSVRGTLRGLHAQRTRPQALLRKVICFCSLPSRFIVQTLGMPALTAM